MSQAGEIISISPRYAIPGGEVIIKCENFGFEYGTEYGVYFGGLKGRLVGVSRKRIVTIVPEIFTGEVEVYLESGADQSNSLSIEVGEMLAEDLHIVANPAVDPIDGSIILTRSGSRGQKLPVTLFKLTPEGELLEMPIDIMNPTGLAFNSEGELFVTNRASGEVVKIQRDGNYFTFVSNLGIATGLAFNSKGELFVGDRSGTIYKVSDLGHTEIFATLEPSMAAYHLAFDKEDNLFVTAPGFSSFDTIWKIDRRGIVDVFFRGLGRPQGLTFDDEGNLYVAACLQGRRGIVRISAEDQEAELFVAGMNVVGLCFNGSSKMIVATNNKVYSLEL
jgi:sugar lactone lactonase YvrE